MTVSSAYINLLFRGKSGGKYPDTLVTIAFPLCLPISGFFHSLFFTCHWISFMFVSPLRPMYHSVDSSHTHYFLSEFPGFGLALVPDVVVSEAEQECAWSRNLKFLTRPGFEPQVCSYACVYLCINVLFLA